MNVSSAMGFLQIPGGAGYAAAKSCVTSLSRTVHKEADSLGITVLALCPGSTRTNLHRAAGNRGRTLGRVREPGFVVRGALAALDASRSVYVPGMECKIKVLLARHAPQRTIDFVMFRGWGAAMARRLVKALGRT